jgi:multimeric flavodoxin WrbA
MSKKVLVFSSSPRKGGNSDLLCDRFIEGANEAGNHTEKIFLRDNKINYCTGCGACQEKGKCVQKDDMAELLDKMVAANVLVMATPVYFYSISAQMKTLIDRTCPKYTKIKNKDMYFIITAADTRKKELERTLECFRGFTDCLTGAKEKGVIYGTGLWKIGDVNGSKTMKQAYEMGKAV